MLSRSAAEVYAAVVRSNAERMVFGEEDRTRD
jgi:hypothetical protein